MIEKAIAVLEALAASRAPMGVSQLSEKLSMPVATVHRQLQALVREELVLQEGSNGLYRLGPRSFSLAHAIGLHRGIEQSRSVLKQLNSSTSYATLLGKLSGTTFTYVDHLPSTTAIGVRGTVGASGYLHSTSLGRSMLSRLDEVEFERVFSQLDLVPVTPETVTDPDALREEIAATRERGYACSRGENEPRVGSVAVAIRAESSQDLYSVCIASHISELDEVLSRIDELKLAAKRLEGLL